MNKTSSYSDEVSMVNPRASLTAPSPLATSLLFFSDSSFRFVQENCSRFHPNYFIGNTKWTLLMVAVACHAEIKTIQLLMDEGARLDDKNVLDITATDIATFYENDDVIFQLSNLKDIDLIEAENATETFLQAATDGDVRLLVKLYDSGQQVRGENLGSRALINASRGGHCEIIQKLLDWGVEVDECDSDGMTPLQHAKVNDHKLAIELLLQRGANPSLTLNPHRKGKSSMFESFLNLFKGKVNEGLTDQTQLQSLEKNSRDIPTEEVDTASFEITLTDENLFESSIESSQQSVSTPFPSLSPGRRNL